MRHAQRVLKSFEIRRRATTQATSTCELRSKSIGRLVPDHRRLEATADEAPALADLIVTWLLRAGIITTDQTDWEPGHGTVADESRQRAARNRGLVVITGRTVFHSMSALTVTCPHRGCMIALQDKRGRPTATWTELSDTIGTWYDGGEGIQVCPSCAQPVGLNDWDWHPPWGFGYLGFDFWNWPQLQPDLLAEVARRLGHRTIVAYGKI